MRSVAERSGAERSEGPEEAILGSVLGGGGFAREGEGGGAPFLGVACPFPGREGKVGPTLLRGEEVLVAVVRTLLGSR